MKSILVLFTIIILYTQAGTQVVHQKNFNRFTHYRINDWVTYAPATHVTAIDLGSRYAYIGTRNGGILRYNFWESEWDDPFTTSSGLRSNKVIELVYNYEDKIENYWRPHILYARTDKGIDEYDPALDYWKPSNAKGMPYPKIPSKQEINDYLARGKYDYPSFYRPKLSELPDLFTNREIHFRPPDEIIDPFNRVFKLTNDRVVDEWRNLWLGTNGLGPAKVNLNDLELTTHAQSISNISPRDLLYLEEEDDIWIGGINMRKRPSGINIWNLDKNVWSYREGRFYPGLNRSNIFTLAANKKFVFAGTDFGLTRYHRKNEKWKTFTIADQLESDKINHLLFLNDTLFIATQEGFNFMTSGYRTIENTNDRQLRNIPVHRLARYKNKLLLATKLGLYEYDSIKDSFSFFQTGSAILDMYLSAVNVNQEQVWVAGRYGISYLNPENDAWISFTEIRQYVPGRINSIEFTPDHVWFATDSGLLKYVISKNHWYLYTTDDGLASNQVYNIDPDSDDLWLSTEKGITIFYWNRPDVQE